mgnify:CR=1 FL=1
MKKTLLSLLVLAAGGAALYQLKFQNGPEEWWANLAHSNGRLELERYDIATLYGGRVEEILVDEGDPVAKGAVVARLDNGTSHSQLEGAEAKEQQAHQAVDQAQAGQSQAKAALAAAQSTIERAKADVNAQRQLLQQADLELKNAKNMRSENLISAAELSRTKTERERAAAAVKASEAQLQQAQAGKEQAAAQLRQANAKVKEAEAAVGAARAGVHGAKSSDEDLTVVSPVAGQVEYRLVQPGSVVAPGARLVSVLDPQDVSMNIFVSNGDMGQLRVGDEGRIVLDGLDSVFPATISFIAQEAQFTPKSVETVDERAKLMFKVKLKIPAEVAASLRGLLKGGMTGNGYVRRPGQGWPSQLTVRLPTASPTAEPAAKAEEAKKESAAAAKKELSQR